MDESRGRASHCASKKISISQWRCPSFRHPSDADPFKRLSNPLESLAGNYLNFTHNCCVDNMAPSRSPHLDESRVLHNAFLLTPAPAQLRALLAHPEFLSFRKAKEPALPRRRSLKWGLLGSGWLQHRAVSQCPPTPWLQSAAPVPFCTGTPP